MQITDYDSLKAAVAAMVNRNDTADYIELFIQQGEDMIMSDVDHPKDNDSIVFEAADYVAIPVDYRRVLTMTQVGKQRLEYYPISEFDDLCATTVGGYIYSMVGENFLFAPWVVGSNVRLVYKRKLSRLSEISPTNWILEDFSSLYLFAALKAFSIWAIEDDRAALFDAQYQQYLSAIKMDALDYAMPEWSSNVKLKVV